MAGRSALSHIDATGQVSMVDVSHKAPTPRRAVAQAEVHLGAAARRALRSSAKGDCLAAARLAGIQAAKRTWELIPLCHQVPLSHVQIDLRVLRWGVRVQATACTVAGTGVEMEALTAASIAALTLYDMLKAADKGITITQVALLAKEGGKSGRWQRVAE